MGTIGKYHCGYVVHVVDSLANAARWGPAMTVEEFIALVREVRSDFAREKDQGLLQDDVRKAQDALAGEYACDRILRRIEARSGVRVLRAPNAGRSR
jgi:hypothetical protein